MSLRVAVIVNKSTGEIRVSETFLHAHIENLPFDILPLIGSPGLRKNVSRGDVSNYITSRSFFPLAYRWLCRKLTGTTVWEQDTKTLSKFLKASRVDVVLAEYGLTGASVVDACIKSQVPLVVHFHGYDAYRKEFINKYDDYYQRMFEYSAAIIGVSKHMCEQLVQLGAPQNKVFHNACGAALPESAKANPGSAEPRFLMVGRLVEKKAPFISVLAFAMVKNSCPGATLTVIGDGPLINSCVQLARTLGVENSVFFKGAQDHETVLLEMTQSRCFIQHSVTAPDGDMEGTPVGVLEAMGCGLPIVSTRHGGIMDVVKEGKTGFLVDEYDYEGMAKHMCDVALNQRMADVVGAAARNAINSYWTSTQSVERLGKIIDDAVAK